MLPSPRTQRALVSLAGLSTGDAFGEQFFGPPGEVQALIASRRAPPPRWRWTDDTAMALSVVDCLLDAGRVDLDALADRFARRYEAEPGRGYGGGAREILRLISHGAPWREAAAGPFGPGGSFGNGAAMRVAPLGAYFAEDLTALVDAAAASAEVTHLHPEGQAGAIAVALAAAYACLAHDEASRLDLIEFVIARTPASEVRRGLVEAARIPASRPIDEVAGILGSGYRVSAQDTVPFCLWVARHHLDSYEDALWHTVAGLGDRDTTCAIVGGIVALRTGLAGIPESWLIAREGLGGRFAPQ